MRTFVTASWRLSLFVQLGLLPACGGRVADPMLTGEAGTGDEPGGAGGEQSMGGTPSTTAPGTPEGGDGPGSTEPTPGSTNATFLAECDDPSEVMLEGEQVSGLSLCDGSTVAVRTGPATCALDVPVETVITSDVTDPTCTSNEDCTDGAHGVCTLSPTAQIVLPVCQYACETDADCGAGSLCDCSVGPGRCRTAHCESAADCGGDPCYVIRDSSTCQDGYVGSDWYFSCRTPEATCLEDGDCTGDQVCAPSDGFADPDGRRCRDVLLCGIGRPFLVADEARRAPCVSRSDWRRGSAATAPSSAAERRVLAERWAVIGQMEHASVAAFARFALELLALGAPAELVERATMAMADETRHAELAFGIASGFADAPLGPGPLSMQGVRIETELVHVAINVFLEGCVGETRAALEAEWAAAHTLEPHVKGVVTQIAAEERSHAELAWAFVKWAIDREPTLGTTLLGVLETASSETAALTGATTTDAWIAEYGLVPAAEVAVLHRAALDEIVRPCLNGLAERAGVRARPATSRRAEAVASAAV